jgi:hypothetical protein
MVGEVLYFSERIVLAPATGRFVAPEHDTGSFVHAGFAVAAVVTSGRAEPVTTPFTGVLAGLLAHDGERVREGQPIAWLRVS